MLDRQIPELDKSVFRTGHQNVGTTWHEGNLNENTISLKFKHYSNNLLTKP